MSELKQFLNVSQLKKHYEVIAYLAEHPNKVLTLAELDYHLPRGASVLQFPYDWLLYMKNGMCSNRNVELEFPADCEGDAEAFTLAKIRDTISRSTIICRRPEITTLEQLESLLQSPSTLAEAEGCVALHTSQIGISAELLAKAQKAGLAYYFPDAYKDREERAYLESKARSNIAHLDAEVSEGNSYGNVVYLALPVGITINYKWISVNGVTNSGAYGIPTTLSLRETLFLTFSDLNLINLMNSNKDAIQEVSSDKTSHLTVECTDSSGCLNIQQKKMVIPMPKGAGPHRNYTKLVMQLETVKEGSFKIFLIVNGEENIIPMTVEDVVTSQPGVLIGRQREMENTVLPEGLLFDDPLLHSFGLKSLPPGRKEEDWHATLMEAQEWLPLPWWQNSSPMAGLVRDTSFPTTNKTLQSAFKKVFSQRFLKEAEGLKVARMQLQQSDGPKKRRTRRNQIQEHVNVHMIHYGLDTSVPLIKKRKE